MRKTNSNVGKEIRRSMAGWLFVLPMIAGIGIFTIFPMVQSLQFSFHKYNVISLYEFVGFGNFIRIFSGDNEMGKVIINSVLFTILNIPVVMVGTYLLALLVNGKCRGIKAFRVLYYLPSIIPAIAGGVLWSAVMKYGEEAPGLFNQMLLGMGLTQSKFFYSDNFFSIVSILIMNLWGLGGGMIIWLAAFKNIPVQLYESAELDGAGRMTKLFKITLPMSTPLMFYQLITLTITTLQFNGTLTFAPDFGKGNNNSTYMYCVKIYNEAFRRINMGYACAMSWVLVAVTALLTGLMFKTNKWVNYET